MLSVGESCSEFERVEQARFAVNPVFTGRRRKNVSIDILLSNYGLDRNDVSSLLFSNKQLY